MSRTGCALLLFSVAVVCCAQPARWRELKSGSHTSEDRFQPASLSEQQRAALLRFLLHRLAQDFPLERLDVNNPDSNWRTYVSEAPVGVPDIVFVRTTLEQGAESWLWLVRLRPGREPQILASPRLGLDGWVWGIQPSQSYGLHDIVLGSHGSVFETRLIWFRFDGNAYRPRSSAIAYSDDAEGTKRMEAERRRCRAAQAKCNLIRYEQPY